MGQVGTASQEIYKRCCIAGGGPAGMVLGLLLARAGVEVVVLEKHADFLRDFRGDTIHPSTLEVMHELGMLEEFLKRPHQEARELGVQIGDEKVTVADFTHLPTRCKFIALMPQWDFLNFIAEQATCYSSFQLRMETKVRISSETANAWLACGRIRCGGRWRCGAIWWWVLTAAIRRCVKKAGLKTVDLGAPMDVLWMRLSRYPADGAQMLGRFDAGRIFIMIDREDYWQCAYVIRKGSFDEIRRNGLPTLREELGRLAHFLGERVNEIASWDDIRLLTVAADRLNQWYQPGLLCIGDAAHAMSPVGGVGINLAVQDAVATANILAAPLFAGCGYGR
jgi:2-polyprenyl-6-methoxyphenol hydroxylase-like FAD-dependent oxidoreductase